MKYSNSHIVFLIIFFDLLLLCSSCIREARGKESVQNKVYKDEIIVHQLSDPTGLHPHNTTDSGAGQIKRLMFQSLLNYGNDLQLVPVLAKELPRVEKTPEGGLVFSYEFRPEEKWDNGSPITTQIPANVASCTNNGRHCYTKKPPAFLCTPAQTLWLFTSDLTKRVFK